MDAKNFTSFVINQMNIFLDKFHEIPPAQIHYAGFLNFAKFTIFDFFESPNTEIPRRHPMALFTFFILYYFILFTQIHYAGFLRRHPMAVFFTFFILFAQIHYAGSLNFAKFTIFEFLKYFSKIFKFFADPGKNNFLLVSKNKRFWTHKVFQKFPSTFYLYQNSEIFQIFNITQIHYAGLDFAKFTIFEFYSPTFESPNNENPRHHSMVFFTFFILFAQIHYAGILNFAKFTIFDFYSPTFESPNIENPRHRYLSETRKRGSFLSRFRYTNADWLLKFSLSICCNLIGRKNGKMIRFFRFQKFKVKFLFYNPRHHSMVIFTFFILMSRNCSRRGTVNIHTITIGGSQCIRRAHFQLMHPPPFHIKQW
jgi:hypothetical protein